MKTNKSFAKRVKVTKNGKALVRKPGINHYNALESRSTQLKRKGRIVLNMSNKTASRFLSNLG
jgi:ribosomal protein L35